MKCPRQFYLGLCFQMRVTPETFIRDPSPRAQWKMSFSGDTPSAGKYTPVMQELLSYSLDQDRSRRSPQNSY